MELVKRVITNQFIDAYFDFYTTHSYWINNYDKFPYEDHTCLLHFIEELYINKLITRNYRNIVYKGLSSNDKEIRISTLYALKTGFSVDIINRIHF